MFLTKRGSKVNIQNHTLDILNWGTLKKAKVIVQHLVQFVQIEINVNKFRATIKIPGVLVTKEDLNLTYNIILT